MTVTFTRPTNLDAATIPVFSGHIRLEATDGQSFNIPYAGVAASMQADFPILDTCVLLGCPESGFTGLTSASSCNPAPQHGRVL